MGAELSGTEPGQRKRVLFLQDFVDVDRPLGAVRERFVRGADWLAPLASAAEEDGEALRLRIGPSWGTGQMTREVRMTLGPPRDRGDALVVPFAWEATGLRTLFPLLEGDLELAPLGAESFRLTLSATYVPPLGELGARLDQALFHRVALSTVRSLLDRVASTLDGAVDEPAAGPSEQPIPASSSAPARGDGPAPRWRRGRRH